MSAFAQTTTGDLDLSSGNLVIEQDEDQCTAWKLTNLFQFFLGEWFADSRLGVPYFQFVFVKNPNLNVISSIFSKVILFAPGVKDVIQSSLNFNSTLRQLIATYSIRTLTGATITGGPGLPFIVSPPPGAQPQP